MAFDIPSYLTSASISHQSVTQLSGGTANYVYRLTEESGGTSIIKHAEPYIASSPQIPLPVIRMDFEHRAMTELSTHLPPSNIRIPKVYRYDAEHHVLLMEDGGTSTLKDAYTDPRIHVKEYGHQLGTWLATLHKKTKRKEIDIGNNVVAKSIYRFAYNGLAETSKSFGLDPELGAYINDKYGRLLATDDDCICHGDFWPGNVLLSDEEALVVDWEMVRRGCGATDVGQFAAEAYLLDRFRGDRGLLDAFLGQYRKITNPSGDFQRRVAVHMGVHLAFWPSRVPWGTKEETRECLLLGHKLMRRADEEDWEWLEGGVLGVLFANKGGNEDSPR